MEEQQAENPGSIDPISKPTLQLNYQTQKQINSNYITTTNENNIIQNQPLKSNIKCISFQNAQPQYNLNFNKDSNYNNNQNEVKISNSEENEFKKIKEGIHNNFLRKVYGLLLFLFIFIFAFIFICQIRPIKIFLLNNVILYYILISISVLIIIASFITFMCKPDILKKVPINYIFLFVNNICVTILLVYISILFKFEYVMGAVALVISICVGVFIICCFKKIETKFIYIVLIITIFLLFVYGILIFYYRNFYLEFLYCLIGAFIFTLFLVYDTQRLKYPDEEGEYEFGTDEYIFAVITLYFDIIRLFIEILKLLGRFGGNGSNN